MLIIPTFLLLNEDCAYLQTAYSFTSFHAFVDQIYKSKVVQDAKVIDVFVGTKQ